MNLLSWDVLCDSPQNTTGVAKREVSHCPRLILSFSHLSPLGHVSFLKNSGQFVILDGYPRKGTALLYQALRAASQFQMHGQVRQINRLLNEAQDGLPTLEAFRI